MSSEQTHFHYHADLNGLEVLQASFKQQNFSRHCHEGYTIGLIDCGAQKFFRSGHDHIAPKNSIILVNADQVHNGQTATEHGWSYRAMYPTPQHFEQLAHQLSGTRCGAPYFNQAVLQSPTLASQLHILLEALTEPSNTLLKESLFHTFMVQLMLASKHSPRSLKQMPNNANLSRSKQFLDEYCTQEISLERLATLCHLSPFHFLRQFKKQFSLTPHAYQIQRRLHKAKQLLKLGSTVIDTAQACGFHDQSHFHRHFKANLGVTPGRYSQLFKIQKVK